MNDIVIKGKSYVPAERNFHDGIRNNMVRKKWDPFYGVAEDEISIAYYDFWRHGEQHEISFGSGAPNTTTLDIDPLWTQVEITQFFDDLQKELHNEYWKGFDFWNNTGNPADRIPDSEWNHILEIDPASPDPDSPDQIWLGKLNTVKSEAILAQMEVDGIRYCKEYFSKWH